MIKYCKTCGILNRKQNVCPLLRIEVDPNKDFCSKHTDSLDQCELCGASVIKPNLIPDGNKWHFLCGECASKLNSCNFCKKVNYCAFEMDSSPLPKMVQQQIRQGNMITVATVKNPERIRQTCQNGCDCFNTEFECMRQFNYCERMDHVYAEQRTDDARESEAPADSAELHSKIHE